MNGILEWLQRLLTRSNKAARSKSASLAFTSAQVGFDLDCRFAIDMLILPIAAKHVASDRLNRQQGNGTR